MPLYVLKTEGCVFEAKDLIDTFRVLGESFLATYNSAINGQPLTCGPCMNSEIIIEPLEDDIEP